MCVCMCMYLCVCPKASNNIWHDMDPCNWLSYLYSLYMAAIVGIISRGGQRNKVHCRNQSNLALCKLSLSL